MKIDILRFLVLSGLVCATVATPVAYAQSDESAALEEIIVTARYREESLQDIGASIKAMSSAALTERGVNTISDLAMLTSGLSNQDRGPNRNEISIRGVGRSLFQQDLSINSPNIGIYFDDVPINVVVGSQMDIRNLDLARVEVVRGPQGTLYGEGAQGGAVRYFSKDPDFATWGTDLSVNFNSIADGGTAVGGTATVNIPISEDSVGARLSVGRFAQDGFIDNIFDGTKDNNSYETNVFRGVLLAEPGNGWRFRLSAHYENFEQDAFTSSNPQDPESRTFCCVGTSDNYVDEDSLVLSANISREFEKVTVQSITSYFERNRERRIFDHFLTNDQLVSVFFLDLLGLSNLVLGGPFPIDDAAVHAPSDFDWEQVSQEFRFISNLDGRFNFVAGAFFKEFEFVQVSSIESDLIPTSLPFYLGNLTALGIPFNPPPANPSNNASVLAEQLGLVGIPELNNAPALDTTSNKGNQVSFFGEATIDVSERLRIIAGLRWHKEDIDLLQQEAASTILSALSPAIPFPTIGEANIEEFLPKLSLEWNINASTLTYLTYSEGIRNGNVTGSLGGFIARSGLPADIVEQIATYGPEFTKAYELGFKSTLLDNRLSLNTAVWFTDIEDVQGTAQIVDPVSGSVAGAVANIGNGHTQGIEAEVVFIAHDNLKFFAGLNWTEAEMDDIFASPILDVSVVPGQRIPFIPDRTLVVGADFNIPISGDWAVSGHIDYRYAGEYTTFILGVEESRTNPALGGFGTVNLGIGVANDRWSVDVRATNLLDEVELIQSLPTTAFIENAIGGFPFLPAGTPVDNYDDYQINRPRTLWLTLRYSY